MNNINWALMTRETLWIVIKISLPFLLGTLLVGLVVSIIQVITQIQEATLTFLPKFILVIGLIMLLLPWICQTFSFYAFQLYDNIRIMGHQI
jgi:flagellar biosynthetic protein FliQ